jgi:hypothetical protein
VSLEQQRIADKKKDDAKKATKKWKPDAQPDDMFWCWEVDGTKNLYSFATISSWKDGGEWHRDPNTEVGYFVRRR